MTDGPTDEDLESNVIVYLRQLEERQDERHKERIQILAALGMLGGSITVLTTGLDLSLVLNLMVIAIAVISAIFVIYKLLITSSVSALESLSNGTVDSIFSTIYVLSVLLVAIILAVVLGTQYVDMSLADVGNILMTILMAGMFVLMSGLMYITGTRKVKLAVEQDAVLREEMPPILDDLVEEDVISEGRKEALVDRVHALLDSDGEPSWFLMQNALANTSEPLRLDTSDRTQLINILGRIKRKAKHGEYDRRDIELIDAIISQAEEGTRQRRNTATHGQSGYDATRTNY